MDRMEKLFHLMISETSESVPEFDKKPKEPTPSKKTPQAIK